MHAVQPSALSLAYSIPEARITVNDAWKDEVQNLLIFVCVHKFNSYRPN